MFNQDGKRIPTLAEELLQMQETLPQSENQPDNQPTDQTDDQPDDEKNDHFTPANPFQGT